jgi:hypothetical protein
VGPPREGRAGPGRPAQLACACEGASATAAAAAEGGGGGGPPHAMRVPSALPGGWPRRAKRHSRPAPLSGAARAAAPCRHCGVGCAQWPPQRARKHRRGQRCRVGRLGGSPLWRHGGAVAAAGRRQASRRPHQVAGEGRAGCRSCPCLGMPCTLSVAGTAPWLCLAAVRAYLGMTGVLELTLLPVLSRLPIYPPPAGRRWLLSERWLRQHPSGRLLHTRSAHWRSSSSVDAHRQAFFVSSTQPPPLWGCCRAAVWCSKSEDCNWSRCPHT